MQLLWANGPAAVSHIVELYPEPRPHVNTVATVMRRLEAKGFVSHTKAAGSFLYHPVARKEDFRSRSFSDFVKNYFGGSYFGAVSALVTEEKISAAELRELLDMVEHKSTENG